MYWKLFIVAAVVAVAGISAEAGGSGETAQPDDDPIVISAVDLSAAYQADKRAANSTYKRRPLVVFGYFAEISGNVAEFQSEANCSMVSRTAKKAMREVPVGTYMVMLGEGSGHVSRDPWISDCRRLEEGDELYVPEFQPEPATTDPEPAQETNDQEPEPSKLSVEMLALFRELYEFRNDPQFHRVGFSVSHEFNDWQVRLDDLGKRRRSEGGSAMSEIGVVPGELQTLAQDYMSNGGCPKGSYTTNLEARLLAAAEVSADECVGGDKPDPPPRAAAQSTPPSSATPAARRVGSFLEMDDESCQTIMAKSQDGLTALQLFCGPFEAGLFEGAGADGVLLNLWVTEPTARDLLGDRRQARQSMTDMVNIWSNLSGESFPTVRVYWKDTLIMTARGKARGIQVEFE